MHVCYDTKYAPLINIGNECLLCSIKIVLLPVIIILRIIAIKNLMIKLQYNLAFV